MKLDFGIASIEVPKGIMLPSLVVGVGGEDKKEKPSSGLGYGGAEEGASLSHRRTLSASFVPLPKGVKEADIMEGELNKIVKSTRAQVTKVDNLTLQAVPAKFVEFKYVGPNQMPLATMVIIVCLNGFLQTFTYTALDAQSLDDARKDFQAMSQSIKPGSYFEK